MRAQQTLADIVRRVDTADVALRMVEVFRTEIAAYRRLPESALDGQVVEISRRNVDAFFNSLVEGRALEEDEVEAFRTSARNRASEGLPLADLLHAYRLGGRTAWEALVEAAEPEEQAALLPGVARLLEHVDRVSAAVTETYYDWSRRLASEDERQVRDLFDALTGEGPLEGPMLGLAETQGMPVADEYAPFVLALPGAEMHVHAQHAAGLRRRGGALAVTEGDRIVGLLAKRERDPAAGSESRVLCAVGEPAPRGELRSALLDLRALLDLGLRRRLTGRIELDDHLPELLLAGSPRIAERLRRRALARLEDYAARSRANLLETLDTFVACDLDRRRAAKRLHVHPNTLDYRLRRVEELTGLRLSRVSDMVLICLALKEPLI
jgi:PucR-like helix-turn-helix protein